MGLLSRLGGLFSRELDMAPAARLQRARKMGFEVDRPLYHGTTNQFDEFSGPTWLAREKEYADEFQWATKDEIEKGIAAPTVIQAYARGRLKTVDNDTIEQLGYHPDEIEVLRRQGFDGVQNRDQVLIFDPANIRRTDAAFDPAKSGSGKLLAAIPAAIGGGLLSRWALQPEDYQV